MTSFYNQVLTKTESISLTHKMSHKLATWDNQKGAHLFKRIGVRVLGLTSLPILGIIDTIAHAALFLGKTGIAVCLLPPNIVITLINRKSVHPDLTFTSAWVHLNLVVQGISHTLTLWVVVLFSPAKAAALSGKIVVSDEDSKKTIALLTKEVEDAKKKNEISTDSQTELNKKIDTLNSEVTDLNKGKDQAEQANKDLKSQLVSLENEKNQAQQELDASNISNVNLMRSLDALRQENEQFQRDQTAKAEQANKDLKSQLASLENEKNQAQQELDASNNNNVNLMRSLDALRQENEQFQRDQTVKADEIIQLKDENSNFQRLLANKQQELDAARKKGKRKKKKKYDGTEYQTAIVRNVGNNGVPVSSFTLKSSVQPQKTWNENFQEEAKQYFLPINDLTDADKNRLFDITKDNPEKYTYLLNDKTPRDQAEAMIVINGSIQHIIRNLSKITPTDEMLPQSCFWITYKELEMLVNTSRGLLDYYKSR